MSQRFAVIAVYPKQHDSFSYHLLFDFLLFQFFLRGGKPGVQLCITMIGAKSSTANISETRACFVVNKVTKHSTIA